MAVAISPHFVSLFLFYLTKCTMYATFFNCARYKIIGWLLHCCFVSWSYLEELGCQSGGLVLKTTFPTNTHHYTSLKTQNSVIFPNAATLLLQNLSSTTRNANFLTKTQIMLHFRLQKKQLKTNQNSKRADYMACKCKSSKEKKRDRAKRDSQ